jgi:hypothetical protein
MPAAGADPLQKGVYSQPRPAVGCAVGQRQEAKAAARALSLSEIFVEVRSPDQIVPGLEQLHKENAQIVVCLYDALFLSGA